MEGDETLDANGNQNRKTLFNGIVNEPTSKNVSIIHMCLLFAVRCIKSNEP